MLIYYELLRKKGRRKAKSVPKVTTYNVLMFLQTIEASVIVSPFPFNE